MHSIYLAYLATFPLAFASKTVFSVHDDLLAFPQYEVVFSNSLISDVDAKLIVAHASTSTHDSPQSSNTKNIESHNHAPSKPDTATVNQPFDPTRESYELMVLNGEQHLCTIPFVEIPVRNETSEAEAKAAEQKEVARATDRGWELLQDLQGNCLYHNSGWWSYAFCYDADITQFHELPPQPGKPATSPRRDPTVTQFILGKTKGREANDEFGNELETRTEAKSGPSKTELQIKGDTRYLVQTMEGGTECDLTRKPRRVEVQFHCNPQVQQDRIAYIKEITTCSYLMVIYTPRLCNDVAFMPPTDNKPNSIVCRSVVPEEELIMREEARTLKAEIEANQKKEMKPIVGGIIIGGGKWMNEKTAHMPIPASFNTDKFGKQVEVIAIAQSKADGGEVKMATAAELEKLELDPEMVEQLKKEVQRMAKEKGWKIEVVDAPGEIREILGIVDADKDEDGEGEDEDEGSEELFKDEL